MGIQGTGQSAPDASPTTDSGFLGESVMIPLLNAAPGDVSRQLVPYAADFGWRGSTYEQSMTEGVEKTNDVVASYASRCPSSMIAVTAYSQGSQIADTVVRNIGAGKGPISADRLAAAALFSSPTRPQGAGVFPGGAAGQSTPTPPKSLPSDSLASLKVTATAPADGGGIAPNFAATSGYGSVAGRVASFCSEGDLACATPPNATLARTVTNIAGQLHLDQQDPLQTLSDLAGALGGATIRTAADVVNEDISFKNDHFTVQSTGKTIAGRLATNSDPRSATPDADADVIRALIKTGVMGLQAGVTIAKKVLTLDTIGQLAVVGMANPPAAFGILAAKVGEAALSLFPPSTGTQVQKYIYNEVTRTVQDNRDLLKMATDLKYWDTARNHTSYDAIPVDSQGQTAADYTVSWFSRLAKELADSPYKETATRSAVATTSPRPTTAAPQSTSALVPTFSSGDLWPEDEPSDPAQTDVPARPGGGAVFAPAQIPTPAAPPADSTNQQ
ncbi:cutinase family protein [Rhodococcus hoagii]|nr:cutinase family protein [Prescottella equi]